MAILTILGWIGDAFAPSLLDPGAAAAARVQPSAAQPRARVAEVDFAPFVLVAVGRLVISDPLFYWFGRRYGDVAIRWMERKLGPSAGDRAVGSNAVPESRVAGRRDRAEQLDLPARRRLGDDVVGPSRSST